MDVDSVWKSLGSRHLLWDILRYYLSIRGSRRQRDWLNFLKQNSAIVAADERFPVTDETISMLFDYLKVREKKCADAQSRLRTEQEAGDFCRSKGIAFGKTRTQSKDHHQASKALVAAVSSVARSVCENVDDNPQTRCIWCSSNDLHVTARNVDGAVPSTSNPVVIWEIKEYWGKTKGGSKMSDAVYECHLVGRELLDFEQSSGIAVAHAVFLDGKDQWGHRVSDLKRFIDLTHQGLIDQLFIGSDVEDEWELWLSAKVSS